MAGGLRLIEVFRVSVQQPSCIGVSEPIRKRRRSVELSDAWDRGWPLTVSTGGDATEAGAHHAVMRADADDVRVPSRRRPREPTSR